METPPTPPAPGGPILPEPMESGSHVNYWEARQAGTPGQPPAYQPPQAQPGPSGKATASLVCGLIGMFMGLCCCGMGVFGIATSVIAIVLGAQEVRAIYEGRSDPAGLGQARAGKLLGIFGIVFNLLALGAVMVYYIAIVVVAVMGGARG